MISYDTYATRRHLPHLQRPGKTYFVTAVTINREVLTEQARSIILETCIRDHEKTYWLHVVVVMPEHMHFIITPYDAWSLSECMQRVKGTSAHRINKETGRRGPLWLSESFDHLLRSNESLCQKIEYVRQNPVRRGLVARPEEYLWLWHWDDGGTGEGACPTGPSLASPP